VHNAAINLQPKPFAACTQDQPKRATLNGPGVPRHSKMRRYQVLLDLIALLLVTEGKSDVAAASLSMHGPITFFYSKNRPLTPQETNYVRSLFEIASGTSRSTAERFEALLKYTHSHACAARSRDKRGTNRHRNAHWTSFSATPGAASGRSAKCDEGRIHGSRATKHICITKMGVSPWLIF
jgi:hypothetical protein